MQLLATKQFNDGIVRGDNRAIGNFVAKTADYAMTDYDCGDVMTNKGATGSVTFTLPAAIEGRRARFLKQAQQTFVVKASGGAKINAGAGNGTYTNSAAENLKVVSLVSDGIDWFIEGTNGTWGTA